MDKTEMCSASEIAQVVIEQETLLLVQGVKAQLQKIMIAMILMVTTTVQTA